MPVLTDYINKNAYSGTEYMMENLKSRLESIGSTVLDNFYIARSPKPLQQAPKDKPKILWMHENANLNAPGAFEYYNEYVWKTIKAEVFVSNYQMNQHIGAYKFTWNHLRRCKVMLNAIDPIPAHTKPTDKIRLLYASDPGRGLDLVYEVFKKIALKYPEVELCVFSSGSHLPDSPEKEAQEKRFQHIYDKVKDHKQIIYSPRVSNDKLKEAMMNSHIFAYPSTYGETSCITLMEAMSAGLVCVHPNSGALFETAAGLTNMYHYDHDIEIHKVKAFKYLDNAIQSVLNNSHTDKVNFTKHYADHVYGWDRRIQEWKTYLENLIDNKIQ